MSWTVVIGPHHRYNASTPPPTRCVLKNWPTFALNTVSVNNDGPWKKNWRHWRWPQARHHGSSLQRDLQEMSHAGWWGWGGRVTCVTSSYLRNDLLVSTLDIVHRIEMILLYPHLLSGNSPLTPPEAVANVLLTVLFFSQWLCVCVCPIQNHTSSGEIFFYISFGTYRGGESPWHNHSRRKLFCRFASLALC